MKKLNSGNGFTLVELLIATAVFSVILLLCATGLIKIGKAYTKGVITSRTQETTRNVIEAVSQSIQFTSGGFSGLVGPGPGNTTASYCIGNQQLSFIFNKKLSNTSNSAEARHVLMTRTLSAGGCPAGTVTDPVINIDNNTAPGQELLSQQMQLANFSITDRGNNTFEVVVRVIYGDDDLFVNPNTITAGCRPGTGVEFCAVSELRTIVQRRVE